MDEKEYQAFLLKCRSKADIERAAELPLDACPRRYCWWWSTLSFDWNLSPADGCEFDKRKNPAWPDRLTPDHDCACTRADPASCVDHHEPREPHLMEDGFDAHRFVASDDWRRQQ